MLPIRPIRGPVRPPSDGGETFAPRPARITSPTSATPGIATRGVMLAVIQSVDNANFPQFATVLINNKLPGEMGYSLPAGCGPFAAGGTSGFHYFYNNSSGVGGSFCYVDADAHVVLSFTGNVSTTPATPYYKALADHLHNGNLNPDNFQNPQPVNLSNGEIASLLPYGNSPLSMQSVIGSDGSLLATLFPGEVKQLTSGTFAGCFQPLADTVKDPHGQTCIMGSTLATSQFIWVSWQFCTTYSKAGGNYIPFGSGLSGGFGPSIWDSNGHQMWMEMQMATTAGGVLFNNHNEVGPGTGGNVPVVLDTTDVSFSNFHILTWCIQPLTSGIGYNCRTYYDGQDVTNTTGYSSITLTPPFYCGWYMNNDLLFPPAGIKFRAFACGTSAVPLDWSSNATKANFDSTGNFLTTGTMQGQVANVTPYLTDFTFHYSLGTTAPYVLTYWYDNGTAGSDAKVYNSSGNTTTNLGHSTSGSPTGTFNTGLSGAGTVYVLIYYQNGSLSWHFQTTPLTGAQVQAAYQDSTLAVIASIQTANNSLSVPSGGGGGGSIIGNGGRAKN